MKPLLLLVDLQQDFLAAPGLEPCAGEVVERAASLLAGARSRGIAVAHAVISVDAARDDRMPHWKETRRWICVSGTPGWEPPRSLEPAPGEPIVRKTDFSAFSTPDLDRLIASIRCDTLILAGLHLHGCVRATALDAYARRLEVWIAEDAVASDDPVHAAVTLRYLERRAARFLSVETILKRLSGCNQSTAGRQETLPEAIIAGEALWSEEPSGIVHCSPRDLGQRLFALPLARDHVAARAAEAAGAAQRAWARQSAGQRAAILKRWAEALDREAAELARAAACDVGKPIGMGEAEVRRAAELARVAASQGEPEPRPCGPGSLARRRPVGVLAAVTPWNNPIAIPVGKIAPALAYGNAVVWKPAPAATRIAIDMLRLLREAGLPEGVVNLVVGDQATARAVLAAPAVSAASLTGSPRAGFAAQEICARRRIPLQAELGGNNASIVWAGSDLASAAKLVARGAFGFAGQRCTANRRAIVGAGLFHRFIDELVRATDEIHWGDPFQSDTEAGPLISRAAVGRVAGAVARARSNSACVHVCGTAADFESLVRLGAYHPPVIVSEPDPEGEIVREETFGPVLVVQSAIDFDRAIQMSNAVAQGLAASIFGGSTAERQRFLDETQAGILKFDQATSDADALAPFGGWKASGVGPPEHGAAVREFFTREQAVYGSA